MVEGIQLEDESLFFSSIENTDEVVVQKSEIQQIETNQTIIQQISPLASGEVEISQETQHHTAYDSRLITAKPKRELPKSSAIGSLYKDIHQEVVTVKDENKIELSAENVVLLWQEFLTENKDKLQNAFLSAAQEQVPELVEDKVTFTASNNISLEMLQLHKMDITAYFRKRTTSNTVVPDFILKRDVSQQKNYKTSKDRLKEMIAENNSVLKLIEKLDLNEY